MVSSPQATLSSRCVEPDQPFKADEIFQRRPGKKFASTGKVAQIASPPRPTSKVVYVLTPTARLPPRPSPLEPHPRPRLSTRQPRLPTFERYLHPRSSSLELCSPPRLSTLELCSRQGLSCAQTSSCARSLSSVLEPCSSGSSLRWVGGW